VFVHDLETGTNELASVTSTGGVPNNISVSPWISGDGRYVTFSTDASNVVGTEPPSACCNNQEGDVFRRDRLLNRTERVTLARDGSELSGGDGSISDDGRYVAFWADHEHRTNPGHANYPIEDVYVKDMVTGDVTLASVGNRGERGNHDSIAPQISPDGHYVTFWTRATNLSSGPTALDDGQNVTGVFQGRVYVYDVRRQHLTFECVPQGAETSGAHCFGPSISEDGRYSLFWSDSDELLPEAPTGGTYTHPTVNLYLRDRRNGHLELINVTDNGTPVGDVGERQFSGLAADRLFRPWVSRDGSVVAFDAAVALTAGDHNGFVDAYVRDRTRGRTIRISETPDGGEGNERSVYPYPTGDGSVVAFLSKASNLSGETDYDWDVFVCRWRQT
jgi:Tol biopolymer transport system component